MLYGEKKKNLFKALLPRTDILSVEITAGKGVPVLFEQLMRVYALSGTDMISPFQKTEILSKLLQNQRISLANERVAARFAILCCDYTLGKYPTPLGSDLSLFHSGLLEKGSPEYIACHFRVLDKKIINSIKEHFVQLQSDLNTERMNKFRERSEFISDPLNIVSSLTETGDIIDFGGIPEFDDTRYSEPDESDDQPDESDDQPDGLDLTSDAIEESVTFVPATVRNSGIVLSDSDSEESKHE